MAKKYFDDGMYNSLPCGIVLLKNDDTLEIVNANKAYYEIYAYGNDETLNVHQDDREACLNLMKSASESSELAVIFKTASGNKNVYMQLSDYGNGTFLGTLWDITKQYEIIMKMEKERNIYAMALRTSDNFIFEHDIVNNTATFYIPSDKKREIKEEFIPDYESYMHNEGLEEENIDFFFKLVYNKEEKMISTRMKIPGDTDWTWYRMHRQFEVDENGNLVRIYGIVSNIEDEKKQEKELKRKIEMDPTLNIYNRNAAVDRINEYLKKHPDRRDFALLVMDIDDFKHINDTYGHLYGDTVIEMAANTLNEVIGATGIVGRYGGDEFFAFIRESSGEQVFRKADDILIAFSKLHSGSDEPVNCSIGIALGDSYNNKVTYKDMFDKADKALYYVKNTGKARWAVFDEEKMSEISGYAIGYETLDINSKDLLESKDMMKVFLELSAGAKNSDNVIGRIMRYITERFEFDRIRVLYVDCNEDLIAIKHDWCTELDYRSFSSKSGYYVHSDIMRFYDYFTENPIFEIKTKNAEGFSLKFVREFEKNMKNEALYIANTTSDNYFYMFECVRFGNERPWTKEECQELNVATKILTMYVSQADKETENERILREQLDFDRKTGLYSMAKFYEQIGKLRKLAAERDESVAVIHSDFNNFLDFNMNFGQEAGDNVIVDFSQHIMGNKDPDTSIAAHIDGTDIFISALRIENDDRQFIKDIEAVNKSFCDIQNEKYQGANIILKTGIYILKPEDVGGDGLDKALLAKRRVKDFKESYCELYEN